MTPSVDRSLHNVRSMRPSLLCCTSYDGSSQPSHLIGFTIRLASHSQADIRSLSTPSSHIVVLQSIDGWRQWPQHHECRDVGCHGHQSLSHSTSWSPLPHVRPGKQVPRIEQIDLPIMFRDPSNYRTETLTFEVVEFKGSYHAILG